MELTGNLQIVCPIRGQLKVNKRSKDGLTATEEFYRVEAIKFLISKGYPKENSGLSLLSRNLVIVVVIVLEAILQYLMCLLQQLVLMNPMIFLVML